MITDGIIGKIFTLLVLHEELSEPLLHFPGQVEQMAPLRGFFAEIEVVAEGHDDLTRIELQQVGHQLVKKWSVGIL